MSGKRDAFLKSVWRGETVKLQAAQAMQGSVFAIGQAVESQAKLLAPVNYGYLAASITTQTKTEGTEPESPSAYSTKPVPAGYKAPTRMKIHAPTEENVALIGTPANYAVYQEFGTSKQDGQPFLRPALYLVQGKAVYIVKEKERLALRGFVK